MAKAGLTARRECRADAKAEHSEPTVRIRCGWRLSDKSYSGDNRLVLPKSPYRRQSSAPRCRLILSWGWRRSQGFGCSPIKKIRELGSDRRKTGRSPICCRRWFLKRFASSTRGPKWTDLWSTCCHASGTRRVAMSGRDNRWKHLSGKPTLRWGIVETRGRWPRDRL